MAVEREVIDALTTYQAAVVASETLHDLVISPLDQDLELLRRSLEAGRITATDVMVFRREIVEAQREYVDAQAAAWTASIVLDLATGRSTYPTLTNQGASR